MIAVGFAFLVISNTLRFFMIAKKGMGRGIKFIIAASKMETDECIIWPMYVMKNGYGQVGTDEGMKLSHRYSCELNHGKPPDDKPQAAHSCGNRACINKRHLSWKSQAENEEDKIKHGTWFTRISGAKLDADKVVEIRRMYDGGVNNAEISRVLSVPKSTVEKVALRKTWKHIK